MRQAFVTLVTGTTVTEPVPRDILTFTKQIKGLCSPRRIPSQIVRAGWVNGMDMDSVEADSKWEIVAYPQPESPEVRDEARVPPDGPVHAVDVVSESWPGDKRQIGAAATGSWTRTVWLATPPLARIGAFLAAVTIFLIVVWFVSRVASGVAQGSAVEGGNQVSQVVGTQAMQLQTSNTSQVLPANLILIDVKGDVVHPGVVEVAFDARVRDVIAAAGGFIHSGDAGMLNLAAPVNDGDELMVPDVSTRSSDGNAVAVATNAAPRSGASAPLTADTNGVSAVAEPSTGHIDLNTADAPTLETIPGIGPAKAEAIIAYRQANGPFQSIQELDNVTGIGAKTVTRMAPFLMVEQPVNGK